MLSSSTIEEIRLLPIENVLKDYITLKPAGSKWLQACCPFHNEKTASFKVNKTTNQWTCFGGCGHGDAIEFVMRQSSLPFIEACERLAKDNGVELKYSSKEKAKTPEQKQAEQTMQQLVYKAQRVFTEMLFPKTDQP